MHVMASTVLAVTDLTSASYKLVGFAAFVAGTDDGEVVLVSTYGGVGGGRRSEPPPGTRESTAPADAAASRHANRCTPV